MAGARKRRKSADCRVALAADVVIGGAVELHARLGEALARSEPVVLDAAAVTRLDTSGVQLLQAFVQARNEGGGKWCWENVGDALRQAASQLGLEQMLELPDVVPASA